MTARILIIEDDADINEVIATHLSRNGFSCTQAYSGSEARLLLEVSAQSDSSFDLVITDLMLPGIRGEELVSLIRARGDVPVIVVSAQSEPAGKAELLRCGADDYLVKPFDLDELLARVSVQLRHAARARGSAAAPNAGEAPSDKAAPMVYKEWELDRESRTFRVAGNPVKLTRIEYNIVEALVRRPKKVFTKQELFEVAWNEECFIEEKAINVHVSNIRGKLKPTGTDSYIETVWGIGFKLAD
ncbi:response regulator transcription factor [Raoultibacter timonensis]|uniref:DNA-binding response regulator n=1 Tax=Raoultibacter timonensis TaxID=1907662 RepID=A0ABM7WLH7_9ACTN|nr:response regulator transcription factor [Raoultibacter timonensis]BDE97247.1 DNA-binding response regulator [Raoultibacter timonensis]BDF51850.1 DNA-binding response regulator [Raoultibacter timonensis]